MQIMRLPEADGKSLVDRIPVEGLVLFDEGRCGGAVPRALVIPLPEGDRKAAVLLSSPHPRGGVLVNGSTPVGGVTLLSEGAEITPVEGGDSVRFSALEPVERGLFPEGHETTRCSRCKQTLEPGDEAARCGCGAWYHEGQPASPGDEFRRCLSYGTTCPSCERPTEALASGPEEPDA